MSASCVRNKNKTAVSNDYAIVIIIQTQDLSTFPAMAQYAYGFIS